MLRSKQIVVVGDQKQLPPTDFFARSGDAGTDDDEDFEDLDDESILESCQKTFGQRRPLRWHYRSRCESLIRFSNEQFYRRELITFPASKPASFSIDLVRVHGTFQARCNPTEASRVAEEAITFMRHHAALDEDEIPSLGIVALNIQQRELIQEELNRLIDDDVLVEQYREKVVEQRRGTVRQEPGERAGRRARLHLHLDDVRPRTGVPPYSSSVSDRSTGSRDIAD